LEKNVKKSKKRTDERFFEELYIEMRSKLTRFAEARIPDRGSAEDVVEETFRTAWMKIDELSASENPHGYLFNTLKLHILKHCEKHAKDRPDKREAADIGELTDIAVPSDTYFDSEISFSDRLTDDEMQIISLKDAGYKHGEIGSMLKVPAGTIHSKVSRIKDKLIRFRGEKRE
jgi:RNA polymerase sigma factor (sigma-70 family)